MHHGRTTVSRTHAAPLPARANKSCGFTAVRRGTDLAIGCSTVVLIGFTCPAITVGTDREHRPPPSQPCMCSGRHHSWGIQPAVDLNSLHRLLRPCTYAVLPLPPIRRELNAPPPPIPKSRLRWRHSCFGLPLTLTLTLTTTAWFVCIS